MTPKKSLETLYSTDCDSLLADVYWRDIRDQADMWEKLFAALSYLSNNQGYLRAMSGELSVKTCSDWKIITQPTEKDWQCLPVFVSIDGIEKLKATYNHACESISYVIPYRISLRGEAVVLLPTEVQEVQITAIDLGDLEWGTLKLQADNEIDVPEGFKAWWTVVDNNKPEDESVMFIELFCNLGDEEKYFCLSLSSHHDIFRQIHFDGIPNDRCAVLTFERLMGYLSKLAQQTGGVLEIYPDLTNFFPARI